MLARCVKHCWDIVSSPIGVDDCVPLVTVRLLLSACKSEGITDEAIKSKKMMGSTRAAVSVALGEVIREVPSTTIMPGPSSIIVPRLILAGGGVSVLLLKLLLLLLLDKL